LVKRRSFPKWIEKTLIRFYYLTQSRQDMGILLHYLQKITSADHAFVETVKLAGSTNEPAMHNIGGRIYPIMSPVSIPSDDPIESVPKSG